MFGKAVMRTCRRTSVPVLPKTKKEENVKKHIDESVCKEYSLLKVIDYVND